MNRGAADLLQDIVADNRATSAALQMVWDAGLERDAVLRHPNCPVAVLSQVAGQALDCAAEPGPEEALAFRHPRCPEVLLLRAVRSGRPELVAAAAACTDLPASLVEEVLSQLALDPRDLLAQARLAEARRLVLAGWNVLQEHAETASKDADEEVAARARELLVRRWPVSSSPSS